MSVSVKTRTMLWGRAAQRCAVPTCRMELVMDATQTDDESLVGEDCHIVAQADDGPRGTNTLTDDEKARYSNLLKEKDKYSNLILLCNVHHKLIDDQSTFHTIELVLQMKADHEKWVRETLQLDQAKQRDNETYATYVEEWIGRMDVENWFVWSSWLLSTDPHLDVERFKQFDEMILYIMSRVWPARYPELDRSFRNFLGVLNDFKETFKRHAYEERCDGWLWTKSFYKENWEDDGLLRKYNFHVDLVHDLTLELTRAANYICDRVRDYIDPGFRLNQGMLLVQQTDGLTVRTMRPEYRGEERVSAPYKGIEQFKQERTARDFCMGQGVNADDPSNDRE